MNGRPLSPPSGSAHVSSVAHAATWHEPSRGMCRHVQALDERRASAGQACSLRVALAAAVLGASSGDRATPGAAALACGLDPAVAAELLSAAAGSAAVEVQSVAVLLLPAIRSALLQCTDAATAQVIMRLCAVADFDASHLVYMGETGVSLHLRN